MSSSSHENVLNTVNNLTVNANIGNNSGMLIIRNSNSRSGHMQLLNRTAPSHLN